MLVFDVDTATAKSTVKEMADKSFYAVCDSSYYVSITLLYFFILCIGVVALKM